MVDVEGGGVYWIPSKGMWTKAVKKERKEKENENVKTSNLRQGNIFLLTLLRTEMIRFMALGNSWCESWRRLWIPDKGVWTKVAEKDRKEMENENRKIGNLRQSNTILNT